MEIFAIFRRFVLAYPFPTRNWSLLSNSKYRAKTPRPKLIIRESQTSRFPNLAWEDETPQGRVGFLYTRTHCLDNYSGFTEPLLQTYSGFTIPLFEIWILWSIPMCIFEMLLIFPSLVSCLFERVEASCGQHQRFWGSVATFRNSVKHDNQGSGVFAEVRPRQL